ncbi:25279_t:CDS:1, partial [Dentiscutata erythropus]
KNKNVEQIFRSIHVTTQFLPDDLKGDLSPDTVSMKNFNIEDTIEENNIDETVLSE